MRVRGPIRLLTLLPAIVAIFAACNDPVVPALGPAIGSAPVTGVGTFADFDPLTSSASCVVPPATLAGFDTYQPFVIPAGHSQRILLDEIADFTPVAGGSGNLPDMNTLNETARRPAGTCIARMKWAPTAR